MTVKIYRTAATTIYFMLVTAQNMNAVHCHCDGVFNQFDAAFLSLNRPRESTADNCMQKRNQTTRCDS